VGSYNLSIEAQGFQAYKISDIRLGGGEQRNVNVPLKVGAAAQQVEVNAESIAIATTDSGEKSFTLETKELQNFTQVGSNAAEYVKIMPGFGISNGTQNKSNYNGATIGINANGDSGSQSPLNAAYSYNGLPQNSLDIVADGAHVSDPGCNCDTPVNPNSDFLQEFKVLTSNFQAEDQKGPILITSVTKAGGPSFHGNAFLSARNYALNANDWLNNYSGVKAPADKYYYPGGSVGGPIIIPGTRLKKGNNKLFFFTGFEYFYQVLDTGLLRATVPTPGELTGNFSPGEVANEGTITASGKAPGELTTAAIAKFGGTTIPMCSGTPNGACIDPSICIQTPMLTRTPPAGITTFSRKSSIRTTGSGPSAATGTSATTPRYLLGITISVKSSSFRWACGGVTETRFRIPARSRVRTDPIRLPGHSPTSSAQA
jgi:hypothetical protein